MGEKLARVQPAAGQERISRADCGGVPKGRLYVQFVIILQKRARDARQEVLHVAVPILGGQLPGNGLQLVGQAAFIGNAVLFPKGGSHGFGMFPAVLPQVGAAAPFPLHGVGNIEHISNPTAVLPDVKQGDTRGAPTHPPAHALFPHVVTGAGRGLRALGVDEDLLVVRVFVEPGGGFQEVCPLRKTAGKLTGGALRQLCKGLCFFVHSISPFIGKCLIQKLF
ncbi:hypothetical protein ADH66_11990 [Acutalibacter muris]|nr:hypothetical protein ADH66_11990 [Acutalibacter muris]